MTHTPGPWRVGPNHKDGSFAIHAGKASVIHATPFSSSNKEAEDNAHLIAAAPELLAALRGVLDAYVRDWNAQEYSDIGGTVMRARAAIAKATGGE